MPLVLDVPRGSCDLRHRSDQDFPDDRVTLGLGAVPDVAGSEATAKSRA